MHFTLRTFFVSVVFAFLNFVFIMVRPKLAEAEPSLPGRPRHNKNKIQKCKNHRNKKCSECKMHVFVLLLYCFDVIFCMVDAYAMWSRIPVCKNCITGLYHDCVEHGCSESQNVHKRIAQAKQVHYTYKIRRKSYLSM